MSNYAEKLMRKNSNEDSPNMSKFIVQLIKKLMKSPIEINSGYCDDFASAINKKFPGAKIMISSKVLPQYDKYFDMDILGHTWVFYKGKHYDAECPGGTRIPQNLPIFKRITKK